MAYLVMKSGKKRNISRRKGLNLWQAITHPAEASDRQAEYIKQMQHLFLDWTTAPDDYIKLNRDRLIPLILKDWAVDRRGRPVRPGSAWAWEFAKKHEFWAFGEPVADVKVFINNNYGYVEQRRSNTNS
jgi:hypothetical protein